MSQKPIRQSVQTASVDDAASPADGSFIVSGSVNPAENRTYDTRFYVDTVQLNRVLKKRYVTYTSGDCHVRSVRELLDA